MKQDPAHKTQSLAHRKAPKWGTIFSPWGCFQLHLYPGTYPVTSILLQGSGPLGAWGTRCDTEPNQSHPTEMFFYRRAEARGEVLNPPELLASHALPSPTAQNCPASGSPSFPCLPHSHDPWSLASSLPLHDPGQAPASLSFSLLIRQLGLECRPYNIRPCAPDARGLRKY